MKPKIINYCKYLEYPKLEEFINKFYIDLDLPFAFDKKDRCMNWDEVRELHPDWDSDKVKMVVSRDMPKQTDEEGWE